MFKCSVWTDIAFVFQVKAVILCVVTCLDELHSREKRKLQKSCDLCSWFPWHRRTCISLTLYKFYSPWQIGCTCTLSVHLIIGNRQVVAATPNASSPKPKKLESKVEKRLQEDWIWFDFRIKWNLTLGNNCMSLSITFLQKKHFVWKTWKN